LKPKLNAWRKKHGPRLRRRPVVAQKLKHDYRKRKREFRRNVKHVRRPSWRSSVWLKKPASWRNRKLVAWPKSKLD
jgi:hypothetical protein